MRTKTALLIIVAITGVTTKCLAAPSIHNVDDLTRPSPINPAIPMDPKPEETITVITDPKEIAKFKREIGKDETSTYIITAPTTVKPIHTNFEQQHELSEQNQNQQRQRRDTKTLSSSTLSSPVSPPKPLAAPTKEVSSTNLSTKRKRKQVTSSSSTTTAASIVKHRQKRDDKDNTSEVVPLIYRDEHKEPIHKEQTASVRPLTLPTPLQAPAHQAQVPPLPTHEAQLFPHFYDAQQHSEMKRDIPVPLVPKYHHPEESPKKEDKEQSSTTTAKNLNTQNQTFDMVQVEDLSHLNGQHLTHSSTSTTTTEHSIFRHHPVPVAELFANAKTSSTTDLPHHQIH